MQYAKSNGNLGCPKRSLLHEYCFVTKGHGMPKAAALAERIGEFREILGIIAEEGPGATRAGEYRNRRDELLDDSRVRDRIPDFVVECRTPRDFWNYIQRAFKTYAERSRYIEAQLLPIERQFRPERQRAPGVRPPEVRIEYSPVRPTVSGGQTYIAEDRITQLRALSPPNFDLCKLVRLCEEINVAYSEGCCFAVAMLVRTIIDHVPPIFGMRNFTEVVSNYAGGQSFKKTMDHMQKTSRNIADSHLHTQARASETLPFPQQVNFAQAMDMLLAEIVVLLQ